MSENVFILGAGASFEAGAPLMNNFLDIAEDLLVSGKVNEHREAYEAVFQAISELQIVYSKSYLDLNNIESLFGAIEMGNIVDRLVKKTGEEIGLVRESLIKLIVHTLEKSMKFPVYDKRIHAPGAYSEFVELVHDLGDSSIITFNYDLGLDYALLSNNQTTIDYCLTPERKGNMKLLKLHGSINWGKCEECGEIIEYSLDNYFSRHRPQLWNDTEYLTLPVSNCLSNLEHCNVRLDNTPVIVPPTWNKSHYHGNLSNVWKEAALQLSEARNIFVFGYSLPETDSFFRYLFALGTASDTRIKRFWVFDPDSTGEVRARYEKLIGKGIQNRFNYFKFPFSKAIGELRRGLDANEGKSENLVIY